jgi:type II secretory pathway component PulM
MSAMNAMKEVFLQRWRSFWAARSGSERRALSVMAAVVALALVTQLLWSVEQSRQQLRRQLPTMAAEAESMRQKLGEWQLLAASTPPRPSVSATLQKEASRRLAALGGGVSAVWVGPGQLRLSGTVSFDTWVAWLGEMQQDFRLTVIRAQITPSGSGRVRLEADLINDILAP